jgi:hypothetical protein
MLSQILPVSPWSSDPTVHDFENHYILSYFLSSIPLFSIIKPQTPNAKVLSVLGPSSDIGSLFEAVKRLFLSMPSYFT